MRIEHIALWTYNLEELKLFYEHYFNATANKKYINPKKEFESYFLTFPDGNTRLELMKKADLGQAIKSNNTAVPGYIHLAISIGSKQRVNDLTDTLKRDGYSIISEPRETGDGYYESCVLDPDGNRIEITE